MLAKLIIQILDFIYPPFRRFMPVQTFRYAACGGGNTLLSLFIFSFSYNFIFQKKLVDLYIITLKPHVAALILSFVLTIPIGFYMARHVVFQSSSLRGRHQLFRYFATAIGSLLLNYINLIILVDFLHIYPTPAQIINTVIVVCFSYLMQKHFAFKKKKAVGAGNEKLEN